MPEEKFTYPFRYVPSPEISRASEVLISKIASSPHLHALFEEGKMLGVLETDKGFLYGFSGLAGGRAFVEGFVPPIFDYSAPDGYFRRREAEISAMEDGIAKGRASAQLQDWLFSQYKVLNANGECKDIKSIFADAGVVAPGGTGDCAAPKLLQYAYLRGLHPIAMGEFWYGFPKGGQVREQGRFYPACTGKCGLLLSFMMRGLNVEPNPLDQEFLYSEPKVLYSDDDIIVASKPSGMLSVPGRNGHRSMLDWLSGQFGEVFSCHRLDMDTSGIMVFARNADAKVDLDRQFACGEVLKTYRARLEAADKPFRRKTKGTIALPLSSDYYDRPRQVVDRENGKLAVTEYEVMSVLPDSEVDIIFRPRTGRTHQLRVHSAHPEGLGRPIKGDRLYGSRYPGRLFLHACEIEFRHPSTWERMHFADYADVTTMDAPNRSVHYK